MKKSVIVSSVILFLLLPVFGISITELDRIVDFSVTLKDLQAALDKAEEGKISRDKYLILDGTISMILPAETQPYRLLDKDIPNPKGFFLIFKSRTNPVAKFLYDKFPEEYQAKLSEMELMETMDQGAVKELLTQINNAAMPRKDAVSLLKEPMLKGQLKPDGETARLLDPLLTDDEVAFWNRLLLEKAFPGEIRNFSLEVELIRGEWDKNENVTSYRCRISFTGSECFKLFNRRTPSSLETVALNTKAIVIARPVKTVTIADSKRVWTLDGLYLRSIR